VNGLSKTKNVLGGESIMASRKVMSLVLLFAMVVDASAYTFDEVVVEYWAGSGSNKAVVVIDFGVDSYAFGYRWEGGTTYGKDLMDTVNAAGSLDYTATGGFLNAISYSTYSNVGQGGWPTDWWSYFISTNGQSWIDSDEGFATRVLSDGVWDGWAHQTTSDWPPAHQPMTPIPEPVTLSLLGLGGVLIRRRPHNKLCG
jgi:hypothetical protein